MHHSVTEPSSQPPDAMSLASELINARMERGLSQAALAEQSGISRSAIKAYETGRNMPGSRELRALCTTLHTTPNKLLFGTEAPEFGEGPVAAADALLRSDPEDQAVSRARLAFLADMLTADERNAMLQLAQSIAIARHGSEKVRQALLGADFMTGMMRTSLDELPKAREANAALNPERYAEKLDAFVMRQGNKKADPKG